MPTSKSSIDHRDIYYRLGKSSGYRARSAWKLLHLDEEFDLFTGVETAVDLCAAPGSWSQVLGEKLEDKLREGRAKVVSLDLQPMAPLKNITILQTDITLPSTIPLVLNALGGRKADLVVCDGAPDVTGVHDLDAYLHSQLLLAALTLSLTLLAPHATLIFKIFLSPLDPQADMLRSQVAPFFQSPEAGLAGSAGDYDGSATGKDALRGKDGYDLRGRRGGVWVRKPRSSRQGSSEAFLVCRNFDPSKVPLPETFTPESLAELAKQTKGTLTLESLEHLVPETHPVSEDWRALKAWVGSGDLNHMGGNADADEEGQEVLLPEQPASDGQLTGSSASRSSPTIIRSTLGSAGAATSSSHVHAADFSTSPPSPTAFLSPGRLHLSPPSRLSNPTLRALNARRDGSVDSASPPSSASPTSFGFGGERPWDRQAPSPLPSPITLHPPGGPLDGILSLPGNFPSTASYEAGPSSRLREEAVRPATPLQDGAVSPALSTGSKTDLFFAASQTDDLPRPPKALPHSASLGRGFPGRREDRDRSATMPSSSMPTTAVTRPTRAETLDESGPSTNTTTLPGIPFPRLDGWRSVSGPAPPPATPGSAFSDEQPVTPISPFGSLGPLPSVPSPSRPRKHVRRESQMLREHRMGPVEVELNIGDVLQAEPSSPDDDGVVRSSAGSGSWRLEKRLGEGAFSAVWSATLIRASDALSTNPPPVGSSHTGTRVEGTVAAIKLTSRALCMSSERTRISFLREVSVLRRLSHPNIVAYVTSFSTQAHHCLVLEALAGGELFEFVADERTRKRMLLPSPRVGEGWDGLEDLQGEGFVRRVFGELARGLGWLHSVGVVHRDVKLENLLLTTNPFALEPTLTGSIPLALLPSPPQPFIKITDFGLSRFISPSSPLLQTRCGSESFAAPEIIMGRPYDGRDTDSWACGVVLYALITGLLPFDESQRGQGGIQVGSKAEEQERRRRMMRIAKGQYTWPTTQVEAVTGMEHAEGGGIGSQEVRSLVGRLLVRDPRKRLRIGQVWEETWMNGPGGVSPALSDSPGGEAGASVDGAPVPPDVRNGAGGGRWVDGGWLGDEQPDDAALYADVD